MMTAPGAPRAPIRSGWRSNRRLAQIERALLVTLLGVLLVAAGLALVQVLAQVLSGW